MVSWGSKYNCTDCGRAITHPGTCADCLVDNNPVPGKLIKDLKRRKTDKKAKRK